MSKYKEQEYSDLDELIENKYVVIVWNDDFNTFEHVIDCLIKYCGHHQQQAEQCTYLIHFKGSCDVKRGKKEKMEKIYNTLIKCQLTCTLEEV